MTESDIREMARKESCNEYDMQHYYQHHSGSDMGVSSVGFRSKKFNPPESTEAMYAKFRQVLSDLQHAENVNRISKQIAIDTENHARQVQNNSTNHLKDRVNDIGMWKNELEQEIQQIALEIITMNESKKRLEKALISHEIIQMIVKDNLNVRDERDGADKVQDNVELSLLKELEITNMARDLIVTTIKQAEEQLKRSRERKLVLELDWSDKKQAYDIDCVNVQLKDDNTCKQFYAGAAKFQETQSTPESWAQFTHDNLSRAEQERMASIQLRCLIDNILETTSNDILKQSYVVNSDFQIRIQVLYETLWKLKEDLRKVYDMIYECELNIEDLKNNMIRRENTLKVAQTRLRNREARPNVELARDIPQYSLISEVNDLSNSIDILIQKSNESENALKDMLDERMALEKSITVVDNSIFIDKEKCIPHRTRYPTKMQLLGFEG